MNWSLLLLRTAAVAYCLGFLTTLAPLLSARRGTVRLTPWLAGFGALAHTGAILAMGYQLGRCPLATIPEVLSALAWAAALIYLAAWVRYHLDVLHIIILPLIVVLLFISNIMPPNLIPLAEQVRPTLLRFHLTVIILGVAALFITFSASLVFVLVDRALKAKRPARFFLALPSLERCDRVGQLSLSWAFPLLTLGIMTGAIVKAAETGSLWSWEPKETLSVIAWGILAVVLVARLGWGWRGRKAAILTIVGFMAVFLRMLGV
jgi:ABC-type uncharacterized transport system permease subunit